MARSDAITNIGLEYYLNQPHSVARHNGYAYEDFVKFVELPKPPNVANLAKLFNVSDPTVKKWLRIYREEKENERN